LNSGRRDATMTFKYGFRHLYENNNLCENSLKRRTLLLIGDHSYRQGKNRQLAHNLLNQYYTVLISLHLSICSFFGKFSEKYLEKENEYEGIASLYSLSTPYLFLYFGYRFNISQAIRRTWSISSCSSCPPIHGTLLHWRTPSLISNTCKKWYSWHYQIETILLGSYL
jgi:hypothetical protein